MFIACIIIAWVFVRPNMRDNLAVIIYTLVLSLLFIVLLVVFTVLANYDYSGIEINSLGKFIFISFVLPVILIILVIVSVFVSQIFYVSIAIKIIAFILVLIFGRE